MVGRRPRRLVGSGHGPLSRPLRLCLSLPPSLPAVKTAAAAAAYTEQVLYTNNNLAYSSAPALPNAATAGFLAMLYSGASTTTTQRHGWRAPSLERA